MLKENPKVEKQSPNEHYNLLLFNKALKVINRDPYEAKILFEDYIQKYPDDYLALSIYVSVLITLKEFTHAKDLLGFLDKKIINENEQVILEHADMKNIDFSRIRLMSFQGQYSKLYDFINNNKDLCERYNLNEVYLLCRKKLGICYDERDGKNYLARQIIKYEKSDMLNKVKYHTADLNNQKGNPYENVFVPDFPLETVIDEIEKYVPSEKSVCPGLLADTYYFRYDNCGKENQKNTDFIKVACFHNTGDIITVCPVVIGKNFQYVDLNYLNTNNNSSPKTKQMSRIDKFNKRYNR